MDFNNLPEIEDRLLAPVSSATVAFAKMFVGIIESFIGGLIASILLMGTFGFRRFHRMVTGAQK